MRKWIILFGLLLIVFTGGYLFVFQKHRDILSEKPDFILRADSFIKEFTEDPIKSEQKYLNKTVEITGLITQVNTKNIVISNMIYCILNDSIGHTLIKTQSQSSLKGRVIGYDDLLEQIKLDQCFILN